MDAIAYGNAGQIQQIFVNLFVNAVQAMGTAGRMRVETRCVGAMIEILVSDSGPGVDPAVMERIFEPFFTTKADAHGTGLGLAISAEFAREHGGSIELRQTSPDGASFCVTLPKETA
ncbi:MAG: ATP-binding protein [Burkholderiaceae bacterium]